MPGFDRPSGEAMGVQGSAAGDGAVEVKPERTVPGGSPARRLPARVRVVLPGYAPPIYQRRPLVPILVFVVVAAGAATLWSENIARVAVLNTALIYAIAAVGLYFAYSVGGLFAFSQAAFMGIGAYTSAKVAGENGFLLGFVVGVAVAFLSAAVLGALLSRARHLYFAIGALAFAELMTLVLRNVTFFAGEEAGLVSGMDRPRLFGRYFETEGALFWLLLAVMCAVLVMGALIERSPLRRDALAAKENPEVARANGVRVRTIAVTIFAFGSALAGAAGSLQAHTLGFIAPETFGVGVAINLYLMILLGGLGSMWGAVVGAFFITWLPELLRPVKTYEDVVFSMLLLVTIVVLPQGIVGAASTLWDRLPKGVLRRAPRE
ncbi:branched-chain amino acid ABC transporter permease [Actinomadura sp. SCN-SB]|uniref:branched-chain amino acid ABC transporter permease n=1 Tax=Actinomadura sp. SCN-SB TaxID=3373092 RepID=UPI0037526295